MRRLVFILNHESFQLTAKVFAVWGNMTLFSEMQEGCVGFTIALALVNLPQCAITPYPLSYLNSERCSVILSYVYHKYQKTNKHTLLTHLHHNYPHNEIQFLIVCSTLARALQLFHVDSSELLLARETHPSNEQMEQSTSTCTSTHVRDSGLLDSWLH